MGLSDLRNRNKNRGGAGVAQATVERPMEESRVFNEAPSHQPYVEQVRYEEPVYEQHAVYEEPIQAQPMHAQPHHGQRRYEEPVYADSYERQMHNKEIQYHGVQEVIHQPVEPSRTGRVDSRFRHIEDGGVYDRKYSPVSSMEVHNVSEFNYGNPDRFGLQVLGVNSSDRIRLLKPRGLEVKPIEISNITDTTGKVSAKLLHYMDRTSATVLPLRECGVFENITHIDGFKIIEIKGKKYASYCGSNYPTVNFNKLIDKIVDRISSAMPYGIEEDLEGMGGYSWNREESRLSRMVNINGREVEVPALCNSEIEVICAKFKPYNCNVIEVANDFPHIIVGVDLEGVGFGEKEL